MPRVVRGAGAVTRGAGQDSPAKAAAASTAVRGGAGGAANEVMVRVIEARPPFPLSSVSPYAYPHRADVRPRNQPVRLRVSSTACQPARLRVCSPPNRRGCVCRQVDHLPNMDLFGKCDAFVELTLGDRHKAGNKSQKSKIHKNAYKEPPALGAIVAPRPRAAAHARRAARGAGIHRRGVFLPGRLPTVAPTRLPTVHSLPPSRSPPGGPATISSWFCAPPSSTHRQECPIYRTRVSNL